MNGASHDIDANLAAAADVERLLDGLQDLLEQQLEALQQGSLAAALSLGEQADQCVQRLVEAQVLQTPHAADQWQRLQRLYGQLRLALAAQREETFAALHAVRRGKKMLRTYGNHLPAV
jgi:hypothetical protein